MADNLSTAAGKAIAARRREVRNAEGDACDARRGRAPGVTDVLTIGANPAPTVYLSGLFHRFGWTVRSLTSLEDATMFLRQHEAAVAIFEESLPGGAWQDAARTLRSLPNPPVFVVIGSDRALLDEVLAAGGFDILMRPLRESDVVWAVASAWHEWITRAQSEDT